MLLCGYPDCCFAPLLYQDYQKQREFTSMNRKFPRNHVRILRMAVCVHIFRLSKLIQMGWKSREDPLRMMETTAFIHVLLMGKLRLLLRWI